MKGDEVVNVMTVRAPDELREKLSLHSKNIGVTRNALILVILSDWIKKQEELVPESDTREE